MIMEIVQSTEDKPFSNATGDVSMGQFLSGKVRRYHQHIGMNQQVSDHSWGAALIITLCHPNPSANLLKAAITHDLHEYSSGDWPSPVKDRNPELKEIEKKERERHNQLYTMPDFVLSPADQAWLRFADKYEALLHLSFEVHFTPLLSELIRSAHEATALAYKELLNIGFFKEDEVKGTA